MSAAQGHCTDQFEGVRQAFEANLENGQDVGASVCVIRGDEVVVDLWGGFRDEARTTPWTADTLVNVWSSTKTTTFLAILMLADRGELDIDAPVSRYWPEFAAAGKETITVRHLLNHTAGLSGWTDVPQPEQLADWELCTSRLAAQEPWWSDRNQSGYHALTQGYLLGEVVRRITGKSFGAFLATEIAGPLGADFHVGLSPDNDARVAPVIPIEMAGMDAIPHDSLAYRTLTSPLLNPFMANESWWRHAEIPAANGHGNAKSLATIQHVISNGGEYRGVRLLSDKGIDPIFHPVTQGTDAVLNIGLAFGTGYGLGTPTIPIGPDSCFWAGFGGSLIVMNRALKLTVAYDMNAMRAGLVGDTRGFGLVMAAAAAAMA